METGTYLAVGDGHPFSEKHIFVTEWTKDGWLRVGDGKCWDEHTFRILVGPISMDEILRLVRKKNPTNCPQCSGMLPQ